MVLRMKIYSNNIESFRLNGSKDFWNKTSIPSENKLHTKVDK